MQTSQIQIKKQISKNLLKSNQKYARNNCYGLNLKIPITQLSKASKTWTQYSKQK
jgi:hypothetical protein